MNYRFFDLPKLPDHLIQQCLDAVVPNNKPFYLVDPTIRENFIDNVGYGEPSRWADDGFTCKSKEDVFDYVWSTENKPVRVSIYEAPDDVVNWVFNIIFPLINSEFSTIDRAELFLMDQGTRMFPHTDFKSFKYNLNFVIETGGDKVETVFYQPKEEHRDKRIMTIIPYRDEVIEPIDRVVVEKHQWGMLERNTLHSVENITGGRLLLQIGVTKL